MALMHLKKLKQANKLAPKLATLIWFICGLDLKFEESTFNYASSLCGNAVELYLLDG